MCRIWKIPKINFTSYPLMIILCSVVWMHLFLLHEIHIECWQCRLFILKSHKLIHYICCTLQYCWFKNWQGLLSKLPPSSSPHLRSKIRKIFKQILINKYYSKKRGINWNGSLLVFIIRRNRNDSKLVTYYHKTKQKYNFDNIARTYSHK